MKKVYLTSLFLLSYLLSYSQDVIVTSFYFDNNSTEVKPTQFDDYLDILTMPIDSIVLEGHADNVGDQGNNFDLSLERTEAVAAFLMSLGIYEPQIKMYAYGEDRPSESNQTKWGQAQNRRVEVSIFLSPTILEPEPYLTEKTNTKITDEAIADNSTLFTFLERQQEVQYFRISNRKDTAIKSKDGLIFYFPRNAFKTSCDSVNVQLKEFNNRKSMILSNVQTVSNSRLLYSRGMYEIQAFCGNKTVSLGRNKKYTAFVPTEIQHPAREKVYGFSGERDPNTNQINWTPTSDNALKYYDSYYFTSYRYGWRARKYFFLIRWLVPAEKKRARRVLIARRERSRKFQEKYDQIDFTKLTSLSKEETKYYIFESANLGYSNLDIFDKEDRRNFIPQKIKLKDEITRNCTVNVVFPDQRSMLMPTQKKAQYFEFEELPKGRKVYLIAIKLEGQDKMKMSVQEAVIDGKDIELTLKPVASMDEMNAILDILD